MNTPTPPTPEQLIAGLKSQIAGLKAALDKALAENVELRSRCGELIRCGDPKPWLIREWGETKNQCPPGRDWHQRLVLALSPYEKKSYK